MVKPRPEDSNLLDHNVDMLEGQAARAFAERLRARADELSRSPTDIARAAGIKRGAMTGYWAGDRLPPANKLFAIADFLELDARWLASGESGGERASLVVADKADWIDVPEYDLREITDNSLGQPIQSTPIRRDWLYSIFRATNGLWLTRLLSDYAPASLSEGMMVICRSLEPVDLAEGHLCLWRAAERIVIGRFSVMPDTIPQGPGIVPRDARYIAPFFDPALGVNVPDLLVPPSGIEAGRYHLVGRILAVMMRPI